jgi:hypothetical protein
VHNLFKMGNVQKCEKIEHFTCGKASSKYQHGKR